MVEVIAVGEIAAIGLVTDADDRRVSGAARVGRR